MKLTPLFLAAAVVCGSAVAQAPDAAQRAENRAKAGEIADKADRAANKVGPGPKQRAENRDRLGELADKADRAADKIGPGPAQRAENRAKLSGLVDRTKQAAKRATSGTSDVAGNRRGDTATMGAGRADDRGDTSRRQRMDDAYGSWRQQQGQR